MPNIPSAIARSSGQRLLPEAHVPASIRTYRLEAAARGEQVFVNVIFISIPTLVLVGLLWPGPDYARHVQLLRELWLGLLGSFVLVGLVLVRSILRVRNAEINANSDGLWCSYGPKSGSLIRWRDIAQVRERPLLQSLELLDGRGGLLLRVDYNLQDCEALYLLIAERAQFPASPSTRQVRSTRDAAWRLIGVMVTALIMLACAIVVAMVGGTTKLLAGLLGAGVVLFASSLWQYLNTITDLHVQPGQVVLRWPKRRQVLIPGNVLDVRLRVAHIAARTPQPLVQLVVAQPFETITLPILGLSTLEVYRLLRAWKAGSARDAV